MNVKSLTVPYYSTHEAADILGCRWNRLHYLLLTKRLEPAKRVGRLRLLDADGVRRAAQMLGRPVPAELGGDFE